MKGKMVQGILVGKVCFGIIVFAVFRLENRVSDFFCLICCSRDKSFYRSRSSHQRCSVKKDVLSNFAKFTGKHLYPSLFFNKVAGLTLLKKRLLTQVFSCEFCEISKNTFLTGRLRWLLLNFDAVTRF